MRSARDVRLIRLSPADVRFTPNSGHRNLVVECPLCAKSGHLTGRRITSKPRISPKQSLARPGESLHFGLLANAPKVMAVTNATISILGNTNYLSVGK